MRDRDVELAKPAPAEAQRRHGVAQRQHGQDGERERHGGARGRQRDCGRDEGRGHEKHAPAQVRHRHPAVDQHPRAAGERAPVAVEAIARQVDQLVGEDGRDLEKEEAGEPERKGRGRQMAALAQAQDGAQRVGEPGHHMELQAERREPRHKALAMVEPGPARAALEPLAQRAGLGEPGLPALRRGVLHRSEDRSAHGGHAAEAERRPGEAVEPGRPIDETMDQRWGVHRDEEMRRLAAQQALVARSRPRIRRRPSRAAARGRGSL